MPKIRPGMPRPPKGFDKISSGLDEYDAAMKDALAESSDNKRKAELQWGVTKVNSQRSRYVFDAFKKGDIDEKVVQFCVTCGFIDGSLMKLWSVPGYESACCTSCVDSRQSTFGGTCVCRVPAKDRVASLTACKRCGCSGCASSDAAQHLATSASSKAKQKDEKKKEEDAKESK